MLNETTRVELASSILACFDTQTQTTRFTASHPEIEAEDSYRIQQKVVAGLIEKGDAVRGYKVGLTSKVMQEQAGTDEPDYSAFLESMMLKTGSVAQAERWIDPFVEIELAFVIKKGLEGPGLTASDVLDAIDYAVPAIEVVDFRLARAPGMDVRDSIADLAAVGGVILGNRKINLQDVDISNVSGRLIVNGVEESTGSSEAVMGNPLNAVAWLANKLSELGTSFNNGDIIMSGSFVRAIPIKPGTEVLARFNSGFGDVSFRFG